ncbi:MAG: transglycosylase SLT domain-containing protein [Hyphomicrobiales bacterium]|nr:transglycosylase SLT domain-containing protein [Hyphomicrobiales bacterium]
MRALAMRCGAVLGFCLCLALVVIVATARNRGPVGGATGEGRRAEEIAAAAQRKTPDVAMDGDYQADAAAATWARRIPDATFARQLAALEHPDQPLKFGPVKIKRELVDSVVRAAQRTDFDPAVLMAIADKESSFSTDVKASTSTATGLFQFVDRTWLRVVRQFGAAHGLEREAAEITGPENDPVIADPTERARVLRLRNQPYLSAVLTAEMLKHDGSRVAEAVGRGLTAGETYLLHFLGPKDANKFMSSYEDDPTAAAAALLKAPARANKPIFYAADRGKGFKALSVEGVHEKFEEMMGTRVGRYADVQSLADVSAYAGR